MKKIIFLTSYYLKYASTPAKDQVSKETDWILITSEEDEIPQEIQSYMKKIYRVEANKNENIRPVLSYEACAEIIKNELELNQNDPNTIRIFCQEECHVLTAAKLRKEFSIPGVYI